jgi:hypothetical protein
MADRLANHPDPEITNVLRLLTHYADMIDEQVSLRQGVMGEMGQRSS